MPNWCSNNITITGPAQKIRALYEAATAEDGGLLNAMVPMPCELGNTVKGSGDELQIEQYDGFTNWYDWCVARWGTKWDVNPEGLEFVDGENGTAELTGYFDSAWAPPVEAYKTFEEQNPDCSVEASYYEMGCDFAGFYSNGDDEYMEGLREEYDLPEDERSNLFKRLDEEFGLSDQFAEYDEFDEED